MRKYYMLILCLLFFSCNQNSSSQTHEKGQKSTDIHIVKLSKITTIYQNYNRAFIKAKKENKAVFILFTTKYCRWCTKLRETTLIDKEIVRRLNNEFIVLLLDKEQSIYPKKYSVKDIPSIYITDKNEEIFTSIVGYHKNPNDYIQWFDYVRAELSN